MTQSDRESVSSGMSLPESDDVDWFDKNGKGKLVTIMYSVSIVSVCPSSGSIDGRSSAAESEREADKRAVHFSRSGTGPIKRLTSHSAVIDSYSHGMVLVTGLQLRSLEKTTKIFKDGDFVCYEADLNAPGAIYKVSCSIPRYVRVPTVPYLLLQFYVNYAKLLSSNRLI